MSNKPKRRPTLTYEALVGCRFVPCLPQHVRRGAVFRVRDGDDVYKAVAAVLPEFDGLDDGVYIADQNGDESGVPITIYGEPVAFTVAPGPTEG
jgi:hypothetical protein